jgi:hypothetical protein
VKYLKFNQYLNEGRSQHLIGSDAIEKIEKNCSDILKNYKGSKTQIWRGIEGAYSDYLFVDGAQSAELRRSRNAYYNYYTLLLDNLPSWKDYPKRSKSIICSTSGSTAEMYGDIYMVFPYNNIKIAVAPEPDIWISFQEVGFESLEDFNYMINIILEKWARKVAHGRFDKHWKQLEYALKSLSEPLKKLKEIPQPGTQLGEFIKQLKNTSNPIKYLDNILNPKRNKFKLITPKDNIIKNDRECWLEGPAILVREIKADRLLEDLAALKKHEIKLEGTFKASIKQNLKKWK